MRKMIKNFCSIIIFAFFVIMIVAAAMEFCDIGIVKTYTSTLRSCVQALIMMLVLVVMSFISLMWGWKDD